LVKEDHLIDLTSAVSFPKKVEPVTQLNNTIYFAASLQNLSLRHLLDRCRTQCTRWVLEMLEKNGDVSTVPEMFGMYIIGPIVLRLLF